MDEWRKVLMVFACKWLFLRNCARFTSQYIFTYAHVAQRSIRGRERSINKPTLGINTSSGSSPAFNIWEIGFFRKTFHTNAMRAGVFVMCYLHDMRAKRLRRTEKAKKHSNKQHRAQTQDGRNINPGFAPATLANTPFNIR